MDERNRRTSSRRYFGDDIDYRWEGDRSPADERDDRHDETDRGYDAAAHSGGSTFGLLEGEGGVFGTSGGGTYSTGFQVVNEPGIYDRSGAPGPFEPGRIRTEHSVYGREADVFDQVSFEIPEGARGPWRGRGPKNYERSNDRIGTDVVKRLTANGDVDASGIEVSVDNGTVTLRGTVPSRRMRRIAEDIAADVAGVRDVFNEIRVRS